MPIYAMSRCFKNGRKAKTPIVYFDAKDEKEAYAAFGAGSFWSGYSENTGFSADIVNEVPKGREASSAEKLIAFYKAEEEYYARSQELGENHEW